MYSLFAGVVCSFLVFGYASGTTCDGAGNACFYIKDPCPSGTEDCSTQYSCSLESNKCCCKKAIGCPDGWIEFGSFCYHYVEVGNIEKNEGEAICDDLGATLPIIKSAEENQFLLNLMQEHGELWLGMEAPYGDNDFYWYDGTSVGETFSAWNIGEPNKPGEENCAYMYVNGNVKGRWNNNYCDIRRLVVCQMEK